MRLTIFEPDASGHHFTLHVRNIGIAARKRKWDLQLVTTEAALKEPAYQILLEQLGYTPTTALMPVVPFPSSNPSVANLLRFQFAQFQAYTRAFRQLSQQDKPDYVYVNTMDTVDKAMSLIGSPFGRIPFSGTMVAINFHHRVVGLDAPGSRRDGLYAFLFRRLLQIPTLRRVGFIDEPFLLYAPTFPDTIQRKLRYLPDAAGISAHGKDKAEARQKLGVRAQSLVILVYGALSERKGILELMTAFRNERTPETFCVLLAGKQDAKIASELTTDWADHLRREGKLVELNRFLNAEEEADVFSASDLVWMGYKSFTAMSGVLVNAVVRSLPVISCSTGVIGWFTRKYELGEVVNVGDTHSVVDSLVRLTDDQLRARYARNAKNIAPRHYEGSFGENVCDMIAETK